MIYKTFGIVPYPPIYQQMLAWCEARTSEQEDQLWLLQHEPVFTLGKAASEQHVLLNPQQIPVVHTNRGGQVTYHGPGQLMVYFLLNLPARQWHVRNLVDCAEQLVLEVLKSYGITGHLMSGRPGVYVNDQKIASLGFRVSRGYSMHGLSLNVDMDLAPFSCINPCGYQGLTVTQMKQFVPKLSFQEVQQRTTELLVQKFSESIIKLS